MRKEATRSPFVLFSWKPISADNALSDKKQLGCFSRDISTLKRACVCFGEHLKMMIDDAAQRAVSELITARFGREFDEAQCGVGGKKMEERGPVAKSRPLNSHRASAMIFRNRVCGGAQSPHDESLNVYPRATRKVFYASRTTL